MRFTTQQYDAAMEALRCGKEQLEPDGHCCAVCGDGGHQAFECGFNPLFAMAMCQEIAQGAAKLHDELHANKFSMGKRKLHELLHWLGGHDRYMGEATGPARVRMPADEQTFTEAKKP